MAAIVAAFFIASGLILGVRLHERIQARQEQTRQQQQYLLAGRAATVAVYQLRWGQTVLVGALKAQVAAAERARRAREVAEEQQRQARLADLRAAQAAAQKPEPQAEAIAATPVPSAPAPAGGRQMTVQATAYCQGSRTADGTAVGWGVIAVDPSVIPLGTHLYVPGYGEAVAHDTGGAVRGNIIDLYMPSCSEAIQWGRRTVTVTIY